MNDYFESIKNKKLALRTYNILIVAVIAWGLGINVLCLNQISDKFVENLIGLNLIVLSLGILFGMSMANFETTLINDAIVTTIVLTLLMICLASFIPSFFCRCKKYSLVGLSGFLLLKVNVINLLIILLVIKEN